MRTLRSISSLRSSASLSDCRRSGTPPPPGCPTPERRVQRAARLLVDHRDRRRSQPPQRGLVHGEHVLAVDRDRAARSPARCGPGSGRSPAPSSTCRSPTRRRGRTIPRVRRETTRRAGPPGRGGAPGRRRRRARRSARRSTRSLVAGAASAGVGAHCSIAPSTASAIRLTPITSEASAMASNSTSHQ